MATTVQTILNQAIQRSDLNNPDLVPTAQVLNWVNNFQKSVYLRAARLNPEYFGTSGATAVRAAYTDTWALDTTPGNVAAVTMLEVAAIAGSPGPAVGDRVYIISKRWPEMGVTPRAYIRGRIISGYGTDLGSATITMVSQLTVYYSPLPAAVTALTSNMTLPDEWAELVVLPLARLLATRDNRLQEAQLIEGERQMVQQLFDESVTVFDHGALRPLNAVPAVPLMNPAGPGA